MTLTDRYLTINKKVEKAEKFLAVLFISLIVLIIFASTISRYAFNNPLFGADRLATYLMVWLGFIGFQIAASKLRHIEIEAVKAKVKPGIRYVMQIITSLLAAVFLVIMFVLSWDFVAESKTLNDSDIVLNVPLWQIQLILPISFIVSALRYFFSAFLWLDVLKGRRKEEEFITKQFL